MVHQNPHSFPFSSSHLGLTGVNHPLRSILMKATPTSGREKSASHRVATASLPYLLVLLPHSPPPFQPVLQAVNSTDRAFPLTAPLWQLKAQNLALPGRRESERLGLLGGGAVPLILFFEFHIPLLFPASTSLLLSLLSTTKLLSSLASIVPSRAHRESRNAESVNVRTWLQKRRSSEPALSF